MRKRVVDHSVLGLDLSLSGPAGCHVPKGWKIGDWRALSVETLSPDVPETEVGRLDRLLQIVDVFGRWVERMGPDYSWVEDYAYSARSSSVTKLAELGGAVRVELHRRGFGPLPATASQARLMLLGKLPKKDQKKVTHAALRAAGFPWASGDVMDAFVIANWGRSECGLPFLSLA